MFQSIKDHIRFCQQRITRGWADEDQWGFSEWFFETIIPMLKKMNSDHSRVAWRKILDQMIEGFEAGQSLLTWWNLSEEQEEAAVKKFDKGMKLFHKKFFQLWD